MAISRSLMNRQLQADGGIMQVAPREKFGLGSKLKKFVRKIIPNEVADIAVKAAPFVAPFNPAVAAAMAGLGSFDQTGKIGSSLKRGALTYGGGQAARYLGGAGFQGNPFGDGGAFTGSGFKSGFSTPFGSDTGLGKFFSNQGTEGVQAIDSSKPLKKPLNIQAGDGSIDLATGGADGFGIIQDTVVDKSIVTQNDPSFLKNLFDGISNQDYGKVAKTIGDGAKKFGKAMFTNKDGSIDKAAVMGAITFAASYAEALALANDAGMELTEEEYDEAKKAEKQEEYAGYLTNFFAGRKDGGRIGFESGANEMIKTQLLEEIMPNTDTTTEDYVIIMTEDGPRMFLKSELPSESMMMDTTTSVFGNAGQGRRIPEELRADGGRIGFSEGSDLMTLNVKKMWEAEGEDDPLGTIVKMGMTFRAPIIDLVKIIGVSASTAAGLVADAVKLGYDVTEPIRDVVGDVAGGIYDVGKDLVKGSKTDTRFIQPMYYLRRFGPEKNLTDEETQLAMMEDSVGRDDPKKRRELENIVFGFDDAGMSQRPEDKELSELIKFKEKYNFADGGRIGFKKGSPEELSEIGIMSIDVEAGDDDDMEDMNMAAGISFNRAEKSYLFKKLGGGGGSSRSYTMPMLYRILSNPSAYPNDARVLKELTIGLGLGRKDGGRIGYKNGSKGANRVSELLILRDEKVGKGEDVSDIEAEIFQLTGKTFRSVGGISDIPTGKIRKNNAGVVERDYRDEGGFVPVGIKERADDVPAMLSKNEFVMTADAVRGIGNGSVEEGSKKLYNTMKKAEQVGKA